MTDQVVITESASGHVQVNGELTFRTVAKLLDDDVLPGEDRRDVVVDLVDVTRVDSAGLALLIEWHNALTTSGGSLRYLNASDELQALARVAGVEARFT